VIIPFVYLALVFVGAAGTEYVNHKKIVSPVAKIVLLHAVYVETDSVIQHQVRTALPVMLIVVGVLSVLVRTTVRVMGRVLKGLAHVFQSIQEYFVNQINNLFGSLQASLYRR